MCYYCSYKFTDQEAGEHTAMGQTAAGRRKNGAETGLRPRTISELRLRVGGVELAVVGGSREDCLRQLQAAQAVDEETRRAQMRADPPAPTPGTALPLARRAA